ncbi:MAG: transglutaminase family protein [bacterium]|nr:transglutaminase family protein [bacterium]
MKQETAKNKYIALGREILTALVWGAAVAVGSLSTHTSWGITTAFLGGLAGSLCGYYLKNSRLRSIALAVGALLIYGVWSVLCSWQINSAFLASLLGVDSAYLCYDACQSFGTCFLAVTVLHTLAWRYPACTAIELIVIAIALATPLAGHRDGYICRPYGFVDAIWSRGYDPIPFFKAFGVMVAALFLMATTGRYNRRSTIIDLSILLLLALILSTFTLPNVLTQPLPEQIQMGQESDSEQQSSQQNQKDDKQKDKQAKNSDNKDQQNSQDQKDKQNQQENKDKNDKDQQQKNSQRDANKDNQQQNQNQSQNDDKDKENDSSSPPPPPHPVAVVVFYQSYDPSDGYLYFRQSAQSFYNGKRLVAETDSSFDKDIAWHFPQTDTQDKLFTPVQVATEHMDMFKPINTRVCLMTAHDQPFGLLTPLKMTAISNPNANQFIRAYQVQSQCFTGDLSKFITWKTGNPHWDKKTWDHYLDVSSDKRYADLAQKITGHMSGGYANSPIAKVLACKLWLEDNCTYDIGVTITDKDDVVGKFLFGNRTGYCVHLAHSLTYLARTLRVPARVGTGYAVEARNRYGGSSLMIRSNEAHAWCEIYVAGIGWIPIDVTPKKHNGGCCQPPPDADLQKMLGELAREESGKVSEEGSAPKNFMISVQDVLIVIGKILAVLAALFTIACYIIKAARRLSPSFTAMPKRIDTAYRTALDCLSDVGLRRYYGEAREDFATRCYDTLPALRALTDLHMRKALGDKSWEPKANSKAVSKLYGEFKHQFRQQFPLWKRVLGALNPFSWLLTK